MLAIQFQGEKSFKVGHSVRWATKMIAHPSILPSIHPTNDRDKTDGQSDRRSGARTTTTMAPQVHHPLCTDLAVVTGWVTSTTSLLPLCHTWDTPNLRHLNVALRTILESLKLGWMSDVLLPSQLSAKWAIWPGGWINNMEMTLAQWTSGFSSLFQTHSAESFICDSLTDTKDSSPPPADGRAWRQPATKSPISWFWKD